jgi:DNA-binding NarL/FixJ family response regulator
MNVLIVDDERLAREKIRSMLAAHGDVEGIAEAADAHDAVVEIRRAKPDLVFLDIQMPGADGFDVLRRLRGGALISAPSLTVFRAAARKLEGCAKRPGDARHCA